MLPTMMVAKNWLMELALDEARKAALREEVPVGAIVIDPTSEEILAADGNRIEEFGDPTAHAEMLVLRKAASKYGGHRLINCDLYVTLEPCAHHGVTPPCADALIAAGVARVVVAAVDEDPRVAGAGIARLQAAGVEVKTGVLERAAHAILRPFFHRLRTRRPYITVDDGLCGDDRQRYDARLCTCPSATKLEGLRDRGRLSLRVPREMDLHTLLDALSRTGLTSVLLDRGDPLITSLETVETLQPAIHFSTALRSS